MLVRAMLRNGFGFDMELVDYLPIWVWQKDEDPTEVEPDIGVFEGIVFNIPFIKIIVGRLV